MIGRGDFGVRFTRAWVALYTRNLPDGLGERRRAEIESDLWEQVNDGSLDRPSSRVLERCLRGVPADVWWRYRTLLEQREARQRSQEMMRTVLTSWWGIISAILGVTLLTLGVAGMAFGDGGGGGIVWAGLTLASGGLIMGGLAVLPRRVVAGSRMIAAGAVPAALTIFLIPVAAVIVIGGLWTGHLQLTKAADQSPLQPVPPQLADITAGWYWWLLAALFLFVVGLGALAVLGDGQTATGEDDTSLLAGLAYLAWILSWLGAVISLGVGVVLGARRGIARHRTRPA